MASTKDKKLGWHFLPADRVLTNGDGRKVRLGVELKMRGGTPPLCCHQGMHASERISQASVFERGPVLSRVEVWGDLNVDQTKFCGRSRRVLWMQTVGQTDVRVIAHSMGAPHLVSSGSISVAASLKVLARHDADAFDKAAGAWAKKHGASDRVTSAPPEKPSLGEKDLLKLLAPRIVRTEKEIRRDIGGFYDLTPECSSYSDRLEELLAECDRIRMVEDIDGRGADGYVLQVRRVR